MRVPHKKKAAVETKNMYYDLVTLGDLPNQQWIVEGVLPQDGLVVMYGVPGCGKTFVALDLGLRIANCMPWCGRDVHRAGVVVYVMAEGMSGIKSRIQAWHDLHSQPHEASFIVVPLTFNICEPASVTRFVTMLSGLCEKYDDKVVLIIFDTLARVASGIDENSTKDVSALVRIVDGIKAALGCSVMFVHHGGKDDTRGMRGSSSLLGAVDTCIKLTRVDSCIGISIEKQKDGVPASLRLEMRKHKDSIVTVSPNHRVAPQQTQWHAPQHRALLNSVKSKDVYGIARDMSHTVSEIRAAMYHALSHDVLPDDPRDAMAKHGIKHANVLPARLLAALHARAV